MEHKIKKLQVTDEKSLIEMDKSRAKDIKTRFGMDRLVEDLIQEAMSRGEFNDLPGTGKPLKEDISMQNPHIDFITYKMNEVQKFYNQFQFNLVFNPLIKNTNFTGLDKKRVYS